MNILWIQDLDPRNSPGGAQITDRFMIEALEKKGHKVLWAEDPKSLVVQYGDEIEGAVISNAKREVNWNSDLQDVLGDYGIKWIKYEHDHACVWRAFFPMASKCQGKDCPAKERFGWQYKKASGIVYLSQWQKQAHDFWDGFEFRRVPSHVSPSYIPYKDFIEAEAKYGGERSAKDNLLVASLYRFKGFLSNSEWSSRNLDQNFHHYGSLAFSNDEMSYLEHRNITLHPPVDYSEMPKLMATHDKFIHFSDHFLPYERVAVEAFFAGMKVHTNKNVGATHFKWWGNWDETIQAMDNTRPEFVEFVETIL